MKKKDSSACCFVPFALAGLVLVLYCVYGIVRFFQSPNAIRTIIEFLQAVGICVGLVVLAFAAIVLYSLVFSKQYPSGLSQLSRDYSVRCYPVELEKSSPGPIPMNR